VRLQRKQAFRTTRCAIAPAIILTAFFARGTDTIAAEPANSPTGAASTLEDTPCKSRPPYCGVWGIWGAENLSAANKPWLKGTMVTRTWAQLEPANNRFDFSSLDKGLNLAVENGYQYLMVKIYTGPNAPAWIYELESAGGGGVPAVTTEPPGYYGQPYPYFLAPSFRTLFKRMIDRVAAHIDTYPPNIRRKLIAIQAPIGRSGDAAGYYGKPTDPAYAITVEQWRDYSKEMFGYYYQAYEDSDPLIVPIFHTGDYEPHAWMKGRIPHFWRKNALGGHFYQQHNVYAGRGEAFRQDSLKYQADGWAMLSRDEMDKTPYSHGIWKEAPVWSMYWSSLHALFFGIDFWNIERLPAMDGPEFVPAFEFFTNHAGCHDPAESPGAWIALRDGLDADDAERFPEDTFGKIHPWWLQTKEDSTQRYVNIAKAFSTFGAAQDPDYEPAFYNKSFQLPHLNDVGWDIFHGNYQMYLTQHDPLGTSQGYWRVGPKSQPYGRFARGFNGSRGMNAMYFDLDDKFYSGNPPYRCTLRVVYYDQGASRWALQYDATGHPQQTAVTVTKTNSGTWKEVTVDVADGNFKNRCLHDTDIMLTNLDDEDDVFHMIELNRASAP